MPIHQPPRNTLPPRPHMLTKRLQRRPNSIHIIHTHPQPRLHLHIMRMPFRLRIRIPRQQPRPIQRRLRRSIRPIRQRRLPRTLQHRPRNLLRPPRTLQLRSRLPLSHPHRLSQPPRAPEILKPGIIPILLQFPSPLHRTTETPSKLTRQQPSLTNPSRHTLSKKLSLYFPLNRKGRHFPRAPQPTPSPSCHTSGPLATLPHTIPKTIRKKALSPSTPPPTSKRNPTTSPEFPIFQFPHPRRPPRAQPDLDKPPTRKKIPYPRVSPTNHFTSVFPAYSL